MRDNIFLNSVLTKGAILGFVMLCSHIFEQCAVVYGGTMAWFSVMGVEMLAAAALYVWIIYRFTKSFSVEVLDSRQNIKMFSYGQGFAYALSVSTLAGVIVGLGRYIIHSLVIGHTRYVESMVTSLQAILKSSPESAGMMSAYEPMLKQLYQQPEPTILATVFSSIWGYLFWGTIVALIVAAIVKREPNIFENTNSEE